MKVLSLCDGLSCGQLALILAGVPYAYYLSSEIDKHAIAITQKNFPDTSQLGDIRVLWDIDSYDLLLGGTPCQDISKSNVKRTGLSGKKSRLFWDFVRFFKYDNHRWFLFENVGSIKKSVKEEIDSIFGVKGVLINSFLFSAQNRPRWYWTNIPIAPLPSYNNLIVNDILQDIVHESFYLTNKDYSFSFLDFHSSDTGIKTIGGISKKWIEDGKNLSRNFRQGYRVYSPTGKACCLTSSGGGLGGVSSLYYVGNGEPFSHKNIRKLTPVECERLQTIPDNYTEGVPKTQRLKLLGNAWTVNVISHIFKGLLTS